MNANISKKLVAAMVMPIVIAIFSSNAHAAYPLARITNNTPYPAAGQINYASYLCKNDQYTVAPGQTWTATSRGVCLITWISAYLSLPDGKTIQATTYRSAGTTYSNFLISPTQNDFRVWSDHEWARENDTSEGKSPGFYVINKTNWPVSVALSQVGCLYYGTIPPGGVFKRDVGAVWFTLQADISADGKEPRTDWDCIKPVASIVGLVLVGAATGGYGAFAALPEATAGTVVATGVGSAAGGQVLGGTLVVGGSLGATALGGLVTSSEVMVLSGAVGGAVAGGGIRQLGKFTAEQIGAMISKNSEAKVHGQYAGPAWPFRCDQMPVYHVTGGPSLVIVDGRRALGEGTPLKIYKQNGCGNVMMSGSVPPKNPAPDNLEALLPGNYVRTPAQNDSHIGSLVLDNDGLKWKNRAGSIWKLAPDVPNLKLYTGPDNPHFATYPDIDVVVGNGQLSGLLINGELYTRTN